MSVAIIVLGYVALIALCGPIAFLLIILHLAIMACAINRKEP